MGCVRVEWWWFVSIKEKELPDLYSRIEHLPYDSRLNVNKNFPVTEISPEVVNETSDHNPNTDMVSQDPHLISIVEATKLNSEDIFYNNWDVRNTQMYRNINLKIPWLYNSRNLLWYWASSALLGTSSSCLCKAAIFRFFLANRNLSTFNSSVSSSYSLLCVLVDSIGVFAFFVSLNRKEFKYGIETSIKKTHSINFWSFWSSCLQCSLNCDSWLLKLSFSTINSSISLTIL